MVDSFTHQSFTTTSFNTDFGLGNKTHTTDAMRKLLNVIKSFNTQAKIVLEKTRDHVTNAFLRKAFTILDNSYTLQSFTNSSFTTDDIGGLGHTTNSLLKKLNVTKIHTTNAKIVIFDTKYHDTDAVLKLQEKSYNLSSYTSTSYTTRQIEFKGHYTDASLKRVWAPTFNTNAFLAFPVTKTHSTDVFTRRGYWVTPYSYTEISFTPASYTMDLSGTKHHTDAVLRRLGETRVHFINAFLAYIRTHTTNAWLDRDEPVLVNSYTDESYTKTSYTTDTLRITGHYTDTKLKRLGLLKSHDTGAFLKTPNTQIHHTNARLYKPFYPYPNSYTDVSYTSTSYKVDTLPYKSHTTNAALKKLGYTKAHTTSAQTARVKSHTTDARLYNLLFSSEYSYFESSFTPISYTTERIVARGHTTNAFLNSIRTKSHTTNAWLENTRTKSHSTNAYIQRQLSVRPESYTNVSYTNTSYTVFRFSYTRTSYTDTSYRVDTPSIPRHKTDAALKKLGYTKTHTTNANLARPKTHQTHALLYNPFEVLTNSYTETSYTTTSYTVDITAYPNHSTHALLKKKDIIKQHTTNAYLKVPQQAIHTTDANIKIQEWSYNAASYTNTSYRTKLLTFLGQTTDAFIKIIGKVTTHATHSFLAVPKERIHSTDARMYKPLAVLNNSYTPTSYTPISYTVDTNAYHGHTTDAYLKKSGDIKQHTTNAQTARVKSHTTNAVLYLTTPISVNSYTITSYTPISYTTDNLRIIGHYTDARLKKLAETKTHQTHAFLKVPRTVSHATDARLLETFAILPYSYTEVSYTNTSYTVESLPTTIHTTDAALKKLGYTKQHTTSAYIVKAVSHTTDANIRLTYTSLPHSYKATSYTSTSYTVNDIITKTHTTDAVIVFGILHQTDAKLKRLGEIRTHTTNSALKRLGDTKTHTTDALKKVVNIVRTHTTDAKLKKLDDIKIHTTDAFRKILGIIKSHTTDSALKKLGDTKTHTTDAKLKKLDEIKTHTTDALKKKVDIILTHTTDALKKVINITLTHTTDARLKKLDEIKTHTTDALKKKLDNTLTHTTDALLRLSVNKTFTTDALLKKLDIIKTHTTNALLKKLDITKSHTTNASVQFTYEKVHTTDAFRKILDITKTHTTDSFRKILDITKTHTTDAFKKYEITLTHTTDAFKKVLDVTKTHTTDAFKKLQITKVHTTDAKLKRLGVTLVHTTNAALKKLGDIKQHTTNARLAGTGGLEQDTDAHLIKFGETKSHVTNATLKRAITKTHIAEAVLKGAVIKNHTTNAVLEIPIVKIREESVIAPIIKGTSVITETVKGTTVILTSLKGESVIETTANNKSVIGEGVDANTSL